ncbi:MAG: hypothetical protein H6774_04295 [Pseudomonadales bacterium]|nr:hypothetical protein [Candidatus Woesebacteria bacterium]MCB9802280.1 hypothetical protein [Pseudomonadales bacterium]
MPTKKPKKTKTTKQTKTDAPSTQAPIAPNTSITLTIPAKQATTAYKKTLAKLAQQVRVHGFRLGKVPAHIAQEQLGRPYVVEKALGDLLPEHYQTALKKGAYTPLTYPQFSIVSSEEGKDWEVTAQFAQKPTVTLKNHKKIITDAKKQHQAEQKRKDAENKKKKADAKKSAPEREQPPADPNQAVLQAIYTALITTVSPHIPDLLIKDEVEHELKSYTNQLKQMNMTLEDFLSRRGTDFTTFTSGLAGQALGRLQLTFILQELAETEKLVPSEKQIDTYIAEQADKDFASKNKNNPEYRAYIRQMLQREAVEKWLLAL